MFCYLRLSKQLSKQSRRQWFETPSCLLCRHCNDLEVRELHGGVDFPLLWYRAYRCRLQLFKWCNEPKTFVNFYNVNLDTHSSVLPTNIISTHLGIQGGNHVYHADIKFYTRDWWTSPYTSRNDRYICLLWYYVMRKKTLLKENTSEKRMLSKWNSNRSPNLPFYNHHN